MRESNLLKDTSDLFKITREGLFLKLAENNESSVELIGGMTLYFQRTYQYNTEPFHTFTQRMIPDIVLEGKGQIIVFDPKYRVVGNLGTALGEMHKYRDGIIHRENGRKVVKEVYILTPTSEEQANGMRYFDAEFHEKYGMGAVKMVPGGQIGDAKQIVLSCFETLFS